ncbi:hypothetical protein AAC387_Pa10g1347 [Persea americana]
MDGRLDWRGGNEGFDVFGDGDDGRNNDNNNGRNSYDDDGCNGCGGFCKSQNPNYCLVRSAFFGDGEATTTTGTSFFSGGDCGGITEPFFSPEKFYVVTVNKIFFFAIDWIPSIGSSASSNLDRFATILHAQ